VFKGQSFDFPCGRGGLNSNQNVYQIPVNDLISARNIRYDGFSWRKAPGLSFFDSTPVTGTPNCLGGYSFRPSTSVQRQITAWSNGKIYKETGNDVDNVELNTGLSFTDPVIFVEAGQEAAGQNKKLLYFSRGVTPRFVDGDAVSTSAFSNLSADWSGSSYPAAAIYHDSRVIAYDLDGFSHNFYVSSLSDHTNFAISTTSSARVFTVAPGSSDKIGAMYSLQPEILYIFKYPYGIYQVDTTDYTVHGLPHSVVRTDIGSGSPMGVCKVGNDVFFISATGRIYSLLTLSQDEDPKNADLTAQLNLGKWIEEHVDLSKIKWARLFYDEIRAELWYTYTSRDGTLNDSALIFDLNEPGRVKVAYEDRGEYFNASWPRITSAGAVEYLTAGTGGLVYRLNSVNRAIGISTAYTAEFQFPDTDFKEISPQMAGVQKHFQMLEITAVPSGDYDLGFEVFVDGVSTITDTVNLGYSAAQFDDAEFDTDTFGGQQVVKHRVSIESYGNQLGLRFYNSTVNEDFQIVGVRVYFKPLGNEYEA
jgi:hypothetical protein